MGIQKILFYSILGILTYQAEAVHSYQEKPPVEKNEKQEFSGLEENLSILKYKFPNLEELIERYNITFNGFKDKETLERLQGKNIDIRYMLAEREKEGAKENYVETLVNIYVGERATVEGNEVKVNDGLTQIRLVFSIECADRLIGATEKRFKQPSDVVNALRSAKYAYEMVEKSLQSMRSSFSYDIDIYPEDFIDIVSKYAAISMQTKVYTDKNGLQIPAVIPLDENGLVNQNEIKWEYCEDIASLLDENKKLQYKKIGNSYILSIRT